LDGIITVSVGQILFSSAVNYTTSINIGLLQPIIPVFTTGCAILLKQEDFGWFKLLGLCISISGALIMLRVDQFHIQSNTGTLGILIGILGALVVAIGLIIRKYIVERYSSITVTSWMIFFGSVAIVPYTILGWDNFQFSDLNKWQWLAIIYCAAIPTVVCYTIQTFALKHLNASVVALYGVLQPIDTAILGFFLLNEQIYWFQYVGGFVVIIGLFVVIGEKVYKERKIKNKDVKDKT